MRSKINKKKAALIKKAEALLKKRAAAFQEVMFNRLERLLNKLETDTSGNVIFSVKNQSILREVNLLFEGTTQGAAMTNFLIRQIIGLLKISGAYYSAFLKYDKDAIDGQVQLKIMRRLGYDPLTKQLIPGGYLESVANTRVVGNQVAQRINNAMSSKMGLADFRDKFKADFTGQNKLGLLERYYNTVTFDLFQNTDRTTQKEYADRLELKYAIYSGTEIKTTRDFCRTHLNKVYSRDEIIEIGKGDWKGKKDNNDIFTDCSGYNCRHSWSWISEELAFRLRPELKSQVKQSV